MLVARPPQLLEPIPFCCCVDVATLLAMSVLRQSKATPGLDGGYMQAVHDMSANSRTPTPSMLQRRVVVDERGLILICIALLFGVCSAM